jgi:Zn-dependent M28 family amino/carboxypeptidase
VVRTRFTRNVVGIVEGADAKLKDTYVAFGAHYDHVGYAEGELVDTPVTEANPTGKRRLGAVGGVTYTPAAVSDRIWNGADDDGSGSVTLMSLAKAFATATPKTKRSLIFVWHTGEESGLWGSRYYADFPTVATDKIVAQLNMDMVGRNDKDKDSEENTVYLVGSDRISTELHNINEDANTATVKMTLDYTSNDPGDSEQIYYRSDHYSYAAKGVPIIFYTTGLHPDYHHNTDSVEKIRFEKMAKVSQLIYETGRRVANLDHAPARDNKGARVGKGSGGKLN